MFARSAISALARPAASRFFSTTKTKAPVRVAVTGAAGMIGYALSFRIASGEMLGKDQPVILHLIEVPQVEEVLKGVKMELDDCAFPLLKGVVTTSSLDKGFGDVDYALLVGAKPRGPGMERADLLKENGKIFTVQGKALSDFASKDCKILVVGNPANTNALIAAHANKNIPVENFTAMTMLDHNRALAQVAEKTHASVDEIKKLAIWGNHSPTMYPDLTHCTVRGKPAKSVINDEDWVRDTFMPTVQQRGAAVIAARKSSSAASAANGAITHMRAWACGTHGDWASFGVISDGSYGIEKGIIYSVPVTCENGQYHKVKGLTIDGPSRQYMEKTMKELIGERDAVAHML